MNNLDFIETLLQLSWFDQPHKGSYYEIAVNSSFSSHLDSENEGKTISYSYIMLMLSLWGMDSDVVSYRKTEVACKEAGATEVTDDLEHPTTNL